MKPCAGVYCEHLTDITFSRRNYYYPHKMFSVQSQIYLYLNEKMELDQAMKQKKLYNTIFRRSEGKDEHKIHKHFFLTPDDQSGIPEMHNGRRDLWLQPVWVHPHKKKITNDYICWDPVHWELYISAKVSVQKKRCFIPVYIPQCMLLFPIQWWMLLSTHNMQIHLLCVYSAFHKTISVHLNIRIKFLNFLL